LLGVGCLDAAAVTEESVEAAYAEVERGETTCLPNFAKGVHLVIDDVTVGI